MSMKREGRSAAPRARTTATSPSSSGCRSASSAARPNSGSSSRNNTPRCASETSPGRGGDPPPTSPATEIVWWGARKGRSVNRPCPGRSLPATDQMEVVSTASSKESAGKSVGMRRASIVLPEPGGPMRSALCPPAAAISSARLQLCWPRTSERSTG